ncbi:MAG: zinc dependent phospholipase C family protein [Acholeplasmataceae bacterium]
MPATMTHQLFAQAIIEEHAFFKDIHKNLFKVMMLATQGPDPFFFYGMHPFKKRKDTKRVQHIGSYLHHEDPAKHLGQLLKYAFAKKDKDQDITKHYAIGALMHYVLDRHVHAYVFSISGFDDEGNLSHPYNVYHSYCETLIDIEIKSYMSVSSKKLHPKKNIDISRHHTEVIQSLYQETYPNVIFKDDFIHAKEDMVAIYHTVYDRLGFKRALLKLFLGSNAHAFAAAHPRHLSKKEKKIDVLNLKHQSWVHPEDNSPHQSSVIDMFLEAKKDMLQLMDQILKGDFDLKSYCQNRSYDGMTIGKKMQYQSLRFPL